jgi:protease I
MAQEAKMKKSKGQPQDLTGKKIAILATDGVEQIELTGPREALLAAGAHVKIVSPKKKSVQMWQHHERGEKIDVDVALSSASADDFDALVLPGGVMNPDELRSLPEAVAFVKSFADRSAPIASICHGPWLLVEAGVVDGVRMTSWPSIKTDLLNAGAKWEDEKVVVDAGIVTSRKPDDLPDFNREMIKLFAAHGSDEIKNPVPANKKDKPGASALH